MTYDGMILTTEDANDILDCPMRSDNNAGAATVREYLCKLLTMICVEREIDGKRPFGYSSWQFDIYAALIGSEIIDGTLDADGFVDRLSREEREHADELVTAAIWAILGGEARDGDEAGYAALAASRDEEDEAYDRAMRDRPRGREEEGWRPFPQSSPTVSGPGGRRPRRRG